MSESTWDTLKGVKLSPPTISFLQNHMKFTKVAPVQARAIPLFLTNYDVVVEAVTGSGKTLSYLVPCMEMLLRQQTRDIVRTKKNAVIAVIILPSRELAQQVFQVTKQMLHYVSCEYKDATAEKATALPLYSCQCYIGGRSVQVDVDEFNKNGANVLIGTPGRLFEMLVSSKYTSLFNLTHLELLILDEADKLLEFGFKAKLDAIIKRLPKQRRTGLFSATQTKELAEIARAGMRNIVSVTVRHRSLGTSNQDSAKPQIPELLTNYYAFTSASEKLDRLLEFLAEHKEEKVLVYVMTCASVDWLYEALANVLLPEDKNAIFALHGQMKLEKRQHVHKQVTNAKRGVLVCTDVAARGLDIPEVGVVVQFDPPVDPNTFIHRIGRTARMGRQGKSCVFLLPQEMEYIAFMKLQNVTLTPLDEKRDSIEEGKEALAHLNARRTLLSSKIPDKRKKIHQAHREKLLSRKERRAQLHEEREAHKKGMSKSLGKKKETIMGDVCESPAVLALRRAGVKSEKLLNLATRAFVSFIRAYKEHECRYIFQLQYIDLTDLTHGFGLFKVPNCGEIKTMQILKIPLQEEFRPFLEVLTARVREKREREMEEKKRQREESEADANEDEQKHHRTERNEKLEVLKMTKMSKNERSKAWKQTELDELMKDSYYVKKERRGKISSRALDERMGIDSIENAFLSSRERKEAKIVRKKK